LSVSSQQQPFSLDFDQLNLPQLSNASSGTTGTMADGNALPSKSSTSASNNEYLMDYLLSQITSGDILQSIDALKQLEKQIATNPALIKTQINPLVNAVTLQVRLAFTSPGLATAETTTLVRLCKHLVNVLVQMFSNDELAAAVYRETMHQLLSELIMRLIDQGVHQQTENGAQLVRALNVLMLRILENSNVNNTFSVLLDLLDAGVLSLGQSRDNSTVEAKYAELVMKCIWKLTKALQQTINSKRLISAELLRDVHKFLTATPPAEWKRRAQEKLPLGDMPLRTAKTILNELVLCLGNDVLVAMNEAVDDAKRSIVYQYLMHMLETTGTNGKQSPAAAVAASLPMPMTPLEQKVSVAAAMDGIQGAASVVPVARALTANEALLAIDDIFNNIADKATTQTVRCVSSASFELKSRL
jgi:hypothetical protein